MLLFKLIAHLEEFFKRGGFCIHPGRVFKKGKIYCNKCGKQLGKIK
jgi:hypothetical protein